MVLAVCNVYVRSVAITGSRREGVEGGEIDGEQVLVHYECWQENLVFLVYTLVKKALIEIGCVVTSLVVTRVHCGQTVHPRPILTMEH